MKNRIVVGAGFALVIVLVLATIVYGQTSTPSGEATPTPNYPLLTQNVDWTPVIEVFDTVEMALVPAGCFIMGATDSQVDEAFALCEVDDCRRYYFENAQPVHEVCFAEPFWIDRYEVSNIQIAKFEAFISRESRWTEDERPRESISWLDAHAFCNLRNARLPSEAEWEYAARGVDSLIYPWGNNFEPDNVVFRDNSNGETTSVGSYEENVSWVGAYDMSGNVWEWVNTIYDLENFPYPYSADDGRESNDDVMSSQRVLRGGSWQSNESMLATWYRTSNNVLDSSYEWGFRCARSFEF